jgi:hypothetical protein
MNKLRLLRIPLLVTGFSVPMLLPPLLYALAAGERAMLGALVQPAPAMPT